MKSKFFAMMPNFWATSDSIEGVFKLLREESGDTKTEIKRGKYFVLEFPQGTEIDVSPVDGAWTATKRSLRIVEHNMPVDRVASMYCGCQLPADERERLIDKLDRVVLEALRDVEELISKHSPGRSQQTIDAIKRRVAEALQPYETA